MERNLWRVGRTVFPVLLFIWSGKFFKRERERGTEDIEGAKRRTYLVGTSTTSDTHTSCSFIYIGHDVTKWWCLLCFPEWPSVRHALRWLVRRRRRRNVLLLRPGSALVVRLHVSSGYFLMTSMPFPRIAAGFALHLHAKRHERTPNLSYRRRGNVR